VSALICT